MAHIGLLTSVPTASWLTTLKTRLDNLGHTTTIVNETDIGTHDFSSYDLIAAAGVSLTNANSVAATLTTLNDGGKPLILDPYHEGMTWNGGPYNGVSVAMGLTGVISTAISTISNTITVANSSHPVVKTTATGIVFNFGGTQPYAYYGPEAAIGTKLVETTNNGYGQVRVIPPATTKLTSGTTGGRIILFPMKNEFLGEGAVLLARSLEFLTTGAVVDPPRVESSKLVGYSVLDYPAGIAASSKMVGYAVMDIQHAQVYSSKLVGYAVLKSRLKPVVGQILGYNGDTWLYNPSSYIHQWRRGGTDIAGATNPTYTLVNADANAMISHSLIAVNLTGQSIPSISGEVGPVEALKTSYQKGSITNPASNTHVVALPDDVVAGDTLVVFFKLPATGADARKAITPAGWTLAREVLFFGVIYQSFYRIATGGETSVTFTIAQSHSAFSAAIAWRLSGTYSLVGSAGADGADPPQVTLGTTAETTWLVGLGYRKTSMLITAPPTGYSDLVSIASAVGDTAGTQVVCGSARKVAVTGTENPGVFTIEGGTPDIPQAITLGFRPV